MCDTDGGSTNEALSLSTGHWRMHTSSSVVHNCPLPASCRGDSPAGAASGTNLTARRRRLAEAFSDKYCHKGYTGTLCAVCAEDYYLDPDTNECTECASGSFFTSVPLLALVVALFIFGVCAGVISKCSGRATIAVYKKAQKKEDETNAKIEETHDKLIQHIENQNPALAKVVKKMSDKHGTPAMNLDGSITFESSRLEKGDPGIWTDTRLSMNSEVAETEYTLTNARPSKRLVVTETTVVASSNGVALVKFVKDNQVKFKVLAAFGQIASNVGFNFQISFPTLVENSLTSLGILNLDFLPALGLSCRFDFDFIQKMTAQCMGPIFLSVLLGALYFAVVSQHAKDLPKEEELAEWYPTPDYPPKEAKKVQPEDDDVGFTVDPNECFSEKDVARFRAMFHQVVAQATREREGARGMEFAEVAKAVQFVFEDYEDDEVEDLARKVFEDSGVAPGDELCFDKFLAMLHKIRVKKLGKDCHSFEKFSNRLEAKTVNPTANGIVYAFLTLTFLVINKL